MQPAKVAAASRIYVEGRHDAELVEKIWGDDLRHVGVVVEYLGGIDDLPAIVAEFSPGPGRRLGVLVDHLVDGSKESRIVKGLDSDAVLVTGHPFIDIWQAVRPARVGLQAWPDVPRSVDWKHGICVALGRPANTQADIAATWQWILGRVRDWNDLDPALPREVERLIDFVTHGRSATTAGRTRSGHATGGWLACPAIPRAGDPGVRSADRPGIGPPRRCCRHG